ncbi:MAG: hypothetical protein IPM54_17780 [Polyangiaceae bacterium]|nr:hypothetical protein [Polyangiaceae bacterium]
MADELTAAGKYFLISVPDFANDPVGDPSADRRSQPMTSFLRMGAFHENAANAGGAVQRAYELAKHAQVVSTVQGGHLTEPYGAEIDTSETGVEGKGVFLADQRKWHPDDGTIPVPSRLEQSGALLNRGGWWDHSDGNRVSTTYGDKVEVIRGNYKMVVMHRQDDPAMGGGFDISGGHIQDLGPNSMPGASVRVEFRPGMFGKPGTWHLENTTNNFIQTSDYAGDFFEHWYGNLKHCFVGSESPQEWNEALQKPFNNPEILEKTWARKIEGYTGSSAWRIPTITEETHAVVTSSLTDVSVSITETTYCDGTMTSKTGSATRRVPAMFEETYAVATNTKSDVGNSNDMTIVGAAMETTIAGALGSLTIAGAQLETEIVGLKGSVSIVPFTGEFTLGTKVGLTIGAGAEFQFGPFKEFSFPDDDETKLAEQRRALKRIEMALDRIEMNIQENHTALSMAFQALAVHLGM